MQFSWVKANCFAPKKRTGPSSSNIGAWKIPQLQSNRFFPRYFSFVASSTPSKLIESYKTEEGRVEVPLEHTQVTFVNGLWRKPKLNNRRLKLLQQKSESQGFEFVDPRPAPPSKEFPEHFQRKSGPKGHRWEEKKEKREVTIKKKLKDMPKLIDEYRAQIKKKRETKYEPISLFFPHTIFSIPTRFSGAKSQKKIREERKQNRKKAREKRKKEQEDEDAGVEVKVKEKKETKLVKLEAAAKVEDFTSTMEKKYGRKLTNLELAALSKGIVPLSLRAKSE